MDCQSNHSAFESIIIYFLPWGSGPDGPRKKIQWIASPTTQPVHPSSRPRTNQEPRTVLNALNQKGPEPFPAQRAALSLIIVAGIVPSYGQGTRQSHFRNDPMKYDLKEAIIFVVQTITYWWSMRNLSNCDIQCKLGHIGILFNIYFIYSDCMILEKVRKIKLTKKEDNPAFTVY